MVVTRRAAGRRRGFPPSGRSQIPAALSSPAYLQTGRGWRSWPSPSAQAPGSRPGEIRRRDEHRDL